MGCQLGEADRRASLVELVRFGHRDAGPGVVDQQLSLGRQQGGVEKDGHDAAPQRPEHGAEEGSGGGEAERHPIARTTARLVQPTGRPALCVFGRLGGDDLDGGRRRSQ